MCTVLRWGISASASVRQTVSTRCRTKGLWSAVRKSGRVLEAEMLTGCCLSLAYEIPELPLVSLVPLRNPKLFLPCFVTLAWLQGGRLRLTRYQAGACWGPSTLQSAPGALNRIYCVSSAALPALVDVCAHVALLYHTPAEVHRKRNSFPAQAPYLTSDI